MALTQISTAGVKDDAVTAGKIPANAVGSSELADNAVDTAAIADDAVTTAKLALPLDLADNEKIRLGTGNDMELYHDGSGSYILNSAGSGQLTISSDNALNLASRTGTEYFFRGYTNGAAELYYDNSKKLETTSSGVTVTGDLTIPDKIVHTGDTDTFLEFGTNIISFDTAGSERVRIDGSGRLGIGTTSPETELHVQGAGDGMVRITSADGSSAYLDLGDASDKDGGRIQYNTDSSLRFSSASTERMRIDSAGRVLIGTDTVGDANGDDLTVAAAGHSGITIRSGTSSTSQLMFTDSTSGAGSYTGIVAYRHASDSMGFFTNTGERLTIDSSGKLSTNGETAPDVTAGGLCLNQGSNDGNILTCKSSDINHGRTSVDETDTWFSIRKQSGNNGGAYIHGYTDGSSGDPGIHIAGYIDSQGSTHKAIQLTGARKNPNNTGSTAFQSGNPIVRISNDFDTTVASFTPDGLAFFNDTAASNSLGDYEEGTFTPLIRCQSGTGVAGSNNYGYYTKIGNVVHAYATVHWTSISGTTNNAVLIVGFPFTAKNSSNYRSASLLAGQVVGVHNGTNGSQNMGVGFDPNQSFVYVTGINGNQTSGGNYTHFPTVLSSGTLYGVSLTYLTD